MKTTGLLRQTLMACVVITLLGTVAEAQPGGGRGGRGGRGPGGSGGGPQISISRAQLLGSEDVQAELKIDDGQAATLAAALEAYREERNAARPDFRAMRDMSEEDRAKAVEKMQKDAEALNKKTDEVLHALMEPEQLKRLDQIATQVRLRFGATGALKSKEMRAALSITDEQLAKVEEVETASSEARRKMFEEMRNGGGGGGGGAGGDFRAMFEKSQQETNDKVMAILTDEQRAKLDEMKGKEFEVDVRSLMRGGRGGGGDRNRGGAGGRDGGERRGGDGGGRGERRRPAQDNNDDAV